LRASRFCLDKILIASIGVAVFTSPLSTASAEESSTRIETTRPDVMHTEATPTQLALNETADTPEEATASESTQEPTRVSPCEAKRPAQFVSSKSHSSPLQLVSPEPITPIAPLTPTSPSPPAETTPPEAPLALSQALPSDLRPGDVLNPSAQIVELEKVTNNVVRLQIQLMKISTQFHLAWFKPDNAKSWRLFGYRMTASNLTNAGMICIASSRYKYINNPSAAPRPFLKSGHILNIIGASMVVGGTLTEATLDRVHDHRLAKKGLSPQSRLQEFKTVLSKLNGLLEHRKALWNSCTQLSSTQKAIIATDGLVLRDIRDLTCAEFAHSYCDVVRLRTRRDIGNVTALFGASTAGYLGSLNSLLSVADRQPKQIGVAGIGFITSGTSVVAAPMITKIGGDIATKRAEKNLKEILLENNDVARARFSNNLQTLESLIASATSQDTQLLQALGARKTVYSLKNKMFDSRHEFRIHRRQAEKRELIERQIFASIIGGTNIARGSMLAVAGFHQTDAPKNIFRLVAAASTCYIAGTGVWTFDNLQGKTREEIAKARFRKSRLSVDARLTDDLDSLEEMEDQMSIY